MKGARPRAEPWLFTRLGKSWPGARAEASDTESTKSAAIGDRKLAERCERVRDRRREQERVCEIERETSAWCPASGSRTETKEPSIGEESERPRSWKPSKIRLLQGLLFSLCQIPQKMLNARLKRLSQFWVNKFYLLVGALLTMWTLEMVRLDIATREIICTSFLGLGTLLSGARVISDGMLQAAAECLAAYMKEEDILNGIIYPPISRIRDITQEVAAAVIREAVAEDLAEGHRDMDTRVLQRLDKEETLTYVKNSMWDPVYPTLVYREE